jgi:hypothetical protein
MAMTPTRSSDRLRTVALLAVMAGAVSSVGLMLRVGYRNPSRLLIALFLVWDLSPFVVLVLADMFSKRWPAITRTTLHAVMIVIALGSVALYGDVVLRPRPQPAAMFLIVPVASGLLILVVLPIAALISRRRSPSG